MPKFQTKRYKSQLLFGEIVILQLIENRCGVSFGH